MVMKQDWQTIIINLISLEFDVQPSSLMYTFEFLIFNKIGAFVRKVGALIKKGWLIINNMNWEPILLQDVIDRT